MAAPLFLAAAAALLAAQAPSLTHWDAAELLIAGAGLDITHPPSYPLHACLTRLALLVPAGGWMLRAGLVSVIPAALLVAMLPALAVRLGAPPRTSLLAAALAFLCPLVWEQATTVEKHALHLALALWFARVALSPRPAPARTAFAFGVALAHHPLTLMLAPLGLPALRSARCRRHPARAAAVAVALVAIPLSMRPLYVAIRAEALARNPAAANWGRAARVRPLVDHLLVRQYAETLTVHAGQDRPPLSAHARVYPAALGWMGLLLGALGFAALARRNPGAAAAVGGALLLTIAFRLRFAQPEAITGTYHLQAVLLLAALAPAGLDVALRRRSGGILAGLLVAGVAVEGVRRLTAFQPDASRALGIHDLYAAELAATPPGAVRLSASILDFFAVPALQASLGRRSELPVLELPALTPAGWFIVRDWTAYARFRLPGARIPAARPEVHPAEMLRSLLDANRDRCFVLGAYAGYAAPPDRFLPDGPLYRPAKGPGAARPPARAAQALRRLPSRGWFSGGPAGANRFGATRLAAFVGSFAGRAGAAGDAPAAARWWQTAVRLAPREPNAWLALAAAQDRAGARGAALRALERAAALDPGSPYVIARRLELALGAGDRRAAMRTLEDAFAGTDLAGTPGAQAVRTALARGDPDGALAAARTALAGRAVELARREPDHPTSLPRRIAWLSLARHLAPDDRAIAAEFDEARRRAGILR